MESAERHTEQSPEQLAVGIMSELNRVAHDRSKLITTKASFLAVAAGILITAAVTYEWAMGHWTTVIPLITAVAALGCAAFATRPEGALEFDHEELAEKYFGDEANISHLQRHTVDTYRKLIVAREAKSRHNARAVSAGYLFLMISSGSLAVLFIVDYAARH